MNLSYTNLNDSDLSDLLKIGDYKAYTEIYNRHNALLYNFAYRKTGDREEAQDLIHELFLMLWEKHEELVISTELPAFLFKVLKNKVMDLYKNKKVSERYIHHFISFVADEQNTTDHLIRHNELSRLIEKEVAALPDKMRAVFELSRKTNLSRKQIAAKLDISEEGVKSHMHRALSILKKKLGSVAFLMLFFP